MIRIPFLRTGLGAILLSALAACDGNSPDKTTDGWVDRKHLSQLQAGIWIDPNGCDHWIIDDGAEGYLSQRLQPDGKPVCSGIGEPNTVVGPFKGGSAVADPI